MEIRKAVNICSIHKHANINPADNYHDLLQDAIEQGHFQNNIKQEWLLSDLPTIGEIECSFFRSKEKKMLSMAAKEGHQLKKSGQNSTGKKQPIQLVVAAHSDDST